ITVPDDSGFLAGTTIYGGIVSGLGTEQIYASGDADGDGVTDVTEGGRRNSYYAGVTVPTPLENLSVGVAYDYRTSESFNATTGNTADQWAQTLAGYLSFQISEQLKLNFRGEWAKGTAGTWGTQPAPGTVGGAIVSEDLLGLTTTLDISLWANVLTRIEFRWDNDMANTRAFGGSDDPDNNAFILGANVVYKF
ncbi:MAG: outer membrane beta-barrel protein, partial [Limisphaerales bacterium]